MGPTALFSLAIVALGGLFFLGLDSPEKANANQPLKEVKPPEIAQAPEVADVEAAEKAEEATSRAPGEAAEARNNTNREQKAEAASAPASTEQKDEGAEQGAAAKKAEKKPPPPPPPPEVAPTPPTTDLWLTVPRMGRQGDYVANTDDPAAMDQGAVKLPSTGFPWQDNANTYIAAHVLGYAGTGSLQQFANLPYMTYGDVIYLGDANGSVYTYRVTEIFTVAPQDNWVTYPEPGRDMVTLQTCINPPSYDTRLIVRADRVDVQPAY